MGLTLLMIAICSFWLLNTESGLRWAARQASSIVNVETLNGDASDLSFNNLSITLDGLSVQVGSGRVKWSLSDLIRKDIRVQNLQLNDIIIRLIRSPGSKETSPYQVWQGVNLPLDIKVDALSIKRLKLISNENELLNLDKVDADASVLDNILSLNRLDLYKNENQILLSGKIDLSAKRSGGVTLNNKVDWRYDKQQLITSGSINGTWESLDLTQRTQLPLNNDLTLSIKDLLSHKVSWNGSLNAKSDTVVMKSARAIDLNDGQFAISGELAPGSGLSGFTSKVVGALEGSISDNASQAVTQFEFTTDLDFASDTLTVHQLALHEKTTRQKSARLNVTGLVVGVSEFWSKANSDHDNTSSKADLSGEWQNLAWPIDKPEQQIVTSGAFELVGVASNFKVTGNATGTAYSKPMIAKVDVQLVDRIANVKMLKLNSGNSQLTLSGKAGSQLALDWDLNSPNLAHLLPNASGDLIISGQLRGELKSPTISASAKSNRMLFKKAEVQGLSITANGSLNNKADALAFEASADKVTQDSFELARELTLSINGTGKTHSISANSLLFGRSKFALKANGGLTNSGWLGKLSRLELDDPAYKEWMLVKPVGIKHEERMLTIDQACLANQKQSICLKLRSDKNGLQGSGQLTSLALENLNPMLSLYDISIAGQANGGFNYSRKAGQIYSEIDAQLQALESSLVVKNGEDSLQTFELDSIKLELEQNKSISAKALIQLNGGDRASADITVDSKIESPDFDQANLRGRIVAELSDLGQFQAVTAPLSNLQGSLNANVNLGGSIAAPNVGMQTRLKDGQLDIPDLGLSLKGIDLNATSLGRKSIEVSGNLFSGKGQLDIDGELDFAKLNEPRFALQLSGENIELMHTPEVHIDGDVNTTTVITKDLIDLSGSINLVHADLDFQLPENAILASPDVVLLGTETEQKRANQKIDLTIGLGEQTHINSQGLDTYLTGKLQVLQEPEGIMRANGQVDVKDGRYAAYNQKLKIDKGQLVYTGGAIDDPNLVLRAQKSVDEITAGVSVTGSASAPILQLYSTPSMSDQDVLSVLIFGKPIDNLGSQDGLTLLRIANSLRGDGTRKSKVDSLTESVQDSLGLSNLELQLDGNSPSVVAGKQLSSKFYIGYGYGLLDAAQSLVLRYKINQAWSIQGDVGADSGADLRYQIQR